MIFIFFNVFSCFFYSFQLSHVDFFEFHCHSPMNAPQETIMKLDLDWQTVKKAQTENKKEKGIGIWRLSLMRECTQQVLRLSLGISQKLLMLEEYRGLDELCGFVFH